MITDLLLLSIFAISYIVDVRLGSEYASNVNYLILLNDLNWNISFSEKINDLLICEIVFIG